MKYIHFIGLIVSMFLFSCETKPLPYLGNTIIEDGKPIYHNVGHFTYLNQDSVLISDTTLSNYVYVADFFFTSCPSICPKVMKEMLRIHESFKGDDRVKLVSFTIDPKRDNVARLKMYATNMEADTRYWHFLTGDKDKTLDLAGNFFVAAIEDPTAPGGFDHSGKIVLVDKSGHVRSFTEGTEPDDTPKFIADIYTLLKEYE
ncbi:MAG: SCO family protein [Saprospiraceae bacterium]